MSMTRLVETLEMLDENGNVISRIKADKVRDVILFLESPDCGFSEEIETLVALLDGEVLY